MSIFSVSSKANPFAGTSSGMEQSEIIERTSSILQTDPSESMNGIDAEGRNPLHRAAMEGRKISLCLLIASNKYPLNAKDKEGKTALLWAAHNGHLVACKILLEQGADADIQDLFGSSVLHRAAENGNRELVKLILPTHEHLLELRDGNECTPLMRAAYFGHLEACKVLLETKKGEQALWWAVHNGHLAACKTLLDAGIGIINKRDAFGQNILHIAAKSENCEVVKLLLATHKHLLESPNKWGLTPLMSAGRLGPSEICKVLLDAAAIERS